MTEGKDERKVYLYFVGKRGYGADKVELNVKKAFWTPDRTQYSVCLWMFEQLNLDPFP